MFARSILIGTMPLQEATGTAEPIIRPRWSLYCAGRRSAEDPSTCTHTSTSARFHLQRQTQADGGKTPNPLQPPCLRLIPSAVFDAVATTQESTFARRNVQHSPHRSPVTGCGSESHTFIKRIFTFIPFQKTLGGGGVDWKRKNFSPIFFVVILQEFLCFVIWARGVDGFHLSSILC